MKLGITLIILIGYLGLFWLANTGRYFGAMLNKLFPCLQNPESSFPCYGWVDMLVMLVSAFSAFAVLAYYGYQRFIGTP